jgi:simple sugar transport system ATP-binding protein
MQIALKLNGIRKAFSNNQVLHDVGFELAAGEVTALLGANGAGKSTLVKILSGVHRRDAGSIELFGEPFDPHTPAEAMARGVVTVHQNINEGVVPDLDIASNLLLEHLATGQSGLWLNKRAMHRKAAAIAAQVGLHAAPGTLVSALSLADRQRVSIARAMAYEPRVLVLDEPTSSLSAVEALRLFELIDRLRDQGVAILYISHRMSDIRRLADRIIAMRDGSITGTFVDKPLDIASAVHAMLGRAVEDMRIEVSECQQPALTLSQLALAPGARPFDLDLHEGEIVAVTGLVGSGKSALANVLFGLQQPTAGRMQLGATDYRPQTPGEAIRAGVFLCPRDRGNNAVVPDFNLTRNITLPFLGRYSTFSWMNRRQEQQKSTALIKELDIVCQSADDLIGTLSGGNQQKVIVARWLAETARVLILDEPFQGVDIQARRDISDRLRKSAGRRATLVLVSEIDEAMEVADRIVVLAEYTLAGDHVNRDLDMEQLLVEVSSAGKAKADAA